MQTLIKQYFKHFDKGQAGMAASPQSLNFCISLFEKIKPLSILDAGSGLSSIMFHFIHQNVTTIDDNLKWAMKTEKIIGSELSKTIEIRNINSVLEKNFDFVFYDYGDIETRIYYYQVALFLCNSVMYIDDMHINFYSEYIFSRSKQYKLVNLEDKTKDEFGRYGYLLIKNAAYNELANQMLCC